MVSSGVVPRENLLQLIRSISLICLLLTTRHQYGISALYTQTSFCGENGGGIEKSQLFAQASIIQDSVVPENIYTPQWRVSRFAAPTSSPPIL